MTLVTIFGGTGYLGRNVIERFSQAGWSVRVAARHMPDPDRLPVNSEFMSADIRDPDAVSKAIKDASCVINAVSAYVERGSISYEEIHVRAAHSVAASCAKAGVSQFIHISGIGADASSASRYISARGRGEEVVKGAFQQATILRPGVMVGQAGGLLAALEGVARITPVIPLIGGATRLQPIHVADVAMAAFSSVHDAAGRGHVFELGGPEILTFEEIARRVMSATGRRRLLLTLPFPVARALAVFGEALPGAPLTRAQVALLEKDNVANRSLPGLPELGIEGRGIDTALQELLRSQ